MRDPATLEDFLGEEVVDVEGNAVGTFACYWEVEVKKALLLGVDIPERSGHTHIVPAQGARFSERQAYVKLPFTRDKMINAPGLDCGCEMDAAFEQRIWDYYGLPMPRRETSDLLSEKVEAIGRELRRIFKQGTPTATCAPAPAQETPPAPAAPAKDCACDTPPDASLNPPAKDPAPQ